MVSGWWLLWQHQNFVLSAQKAAVRPRHAVFESVLAVKYSNIKTTYRRRMEMNSYILTILCQSKILRPQIASATKQEFVSHYDVQKLARKIVKKSVFFFENIDN